MPKSPSIPTPIAPWKKWLFAAVNCGLFFAMLELGLWVAGVPTLIEHEDPFRGFSGLVKVFEREGDVYRTRRAVAGNTFNDQSFLANKPANGLRVFCLGGSSAFGFPWGADVAFTSILGEVLAASHPERRVEAVNAAGISYAMHRMNIVADELLSYQPDVFLVYEGHNEFIEPAFFELLKHRSEVRTRLEYALSHWRLYSGLRLVTERLKKREQAAASPLDLMVRREETRSYSPEQKEAIVAEFRWRLERLVRRAQAAGVKVVLATVPCNLREWRPNGSAGVASLSAPDRQRWSDLFASGQRRLMGAVFESAALDLEQAAQLAPHHAETQFLLAQAYERLGRLDEARAAYQRACDEDASPTRRLSAINVAIRDVAHQSGALLVDMDEVFTRRSEHGLVGFNLIEDYVHPTPEGHQLIAWHMWDAMERAGWFGAKRTAEQALFDRTVAERRPKAQARNATWFYNEGVILETQGHLDAAIKSYRQAVVESPRYAGALLNLSILLSRTGKPAEALSFCERLVAAFPGHAEGHNTMGNILQALGRPQEAVASYRKALKVKPDYAAARNNLGNALTSLGQGPEAITQFREALRLKPDFPEAHNSLGLALASQGQTAGAISEFRESVRLRPDFPQARMNLGRALELSGDVEEAIAQYEEAVRLNADLRLALTSLAWIRATSADPRLRDGAEAVRLAERACQLTGRKQVTALDTLATAYAAAQRFPEAVATAKEAVALARSADHASLANQIQARLDLYRTNQAYRESSRPTAPAATGR